MRYLSFVDFVRCVGRSSAAKWTWTGSQDPGPPPRSARIRRRQIKRTRRLAERERRREVSP